MDRYRVIAYDVVVPDLPVDLLGRENLARVAAQQLKDFIFERRQAHGFPVHGDAFALGIEHQTSYHNLGRSLFHRAELCIAAQLTFYTRDQLGRIERLGHVVVRACCQAEYLVRVLGFCREQDDRDVAALAQPEQRFDAVQLGHHDVEHDEMHGLRHHDVERFQSVVRLFDLVAIRFQENRDAVHDFAVVVHDQNLQLFHFSLPLSMLLSYHKFLLFSAGNFFRFY